jgi:spore coat polysaccharide biosynthesis protein SpsF
MTGVAERRVAAIIQARMGSTRFPGKVLRPLAGKPVLWHILHRLRECRTLDVIAVATSTGAGDDPLAAWCGEQGVRCVRGPEDDVLARYLLAARELSADVLVRVTGDAPLVDPGMVDRLVMALLAQGADYAGGDPATPSIHEGFEPVTREALERTAAEAGGDRAAVEHVTSWIKRHPERFRIAVAPVPEEHRFTGARLSVDTPADLAFLEEIYRRLGGPAGDADVAAVVRLLRDDPGLLAVNRDVRQKTVEERTRKVLIRCDGDGTIGLGHVVRCLALADELRRSHSWGAAFALASGPAGAALVREAGFAIEEIPAGEDESGWLSRLLAGGLYDALVLDVRTGLSREKVRRWREAGVLVIDIDDPEDKRREADLCFYPPVPQVREMDWSGFGGRLLCGWEWALLRPQFAGGGDRGMRAANAPPVILVAMGGADPAHLTELAARALDLVEVPFTAVFVLGRAYPRGGELEGMLSKVRYPHRVMRDVPDMAALMAKSDLAVAAFGVTAYEMAAMGLPAVSLEISADHQQSASLLAAEGIAVSLGDYRKVTPRHLADEVKALLGDPARRREMGKRAAAMVDGRGAARMADLIVRGMSGHA